MLKELICGLNYKLIDAWRIINDNGKGIIFVTDENEKLVGILSDGDIRRILLNNKGDLHCLVGSVMNKHFVWANSNVEPKSLLTKFNNQIKIIPLVNDNFELVDYIEYSKSFSLPVASPNLSGNEFNYLVDAFLSSWISSSGKYLDLFEQKFADYCGTKYAVAVSNGTTALHLSLLSLGIGEGDEVIIPDLTFAATINTVLHANAKPVIVDIEEESWCIDPNEIEKAITKKTKAIIPVHLYGQPANMDEILKIAKKYKLFVIEDAAEAHGAEFGGKKVGSIGDIGCFSFYGNKVITTGEGGMCVTDSEEIAQKIRIYKDHGMSKQKRYWHDVVGYNYRMTNLQAAIGLAQLERIDDILKSREEIETRYRDELDGIQGLKIQVNNLPNRNKITWLVCASLESKNRDQIMNHLKKEGIDTRPFFYSLSDMELYKDYCFSNNVSRSVSSRGINFPTISGLNSAYFEKLKSVLSEIIK